MFHDIPKNILEQMKILEDLDTQDRQDGTTQVKRLRQISPDTGRFIAIQAATVPEGSWVEVGTSAGYSALWISLAAKLKKEKLFTYELLQDKVTLAKNTFKLTKVKEYVELVHGDARGHVGRYEEIAFAFLDSEKEMYDEFYDLIVPLLVPGGLLIADNLVSHKEFFSSFIAKVEKDERVDSVIVPIGKGLLLCRKV